MSNTLRRRLRNPDFQWNQAVRDMEHLLVEAQLRVEQIVVSLEHFKKMRDSGEPWPGTVEAGGSEAVNTRRLPQASE